MAEQNRGKPPNPPMTPERYGRAWVMSECMREDLGLAGERKPQPDAEPKPRSRRKRRKP